MSGTAAKADYRITLSDVAWRVTDSWEAAAILMDRQGRFGFCVAPDGEIRVRWQGKWLTREDMRAVEPDGTLGAPRRRYRADLDG